jgi:5,5'-dehydrodivanillate O-demethylase
VDHYEEEHNFIPFEYGIIKQRRTPGRKPGEGSQLDQHPLVFPITLRHVFRALKTDGLFRHNLQIRVPVDDAHTQVYVVYFTPNDTDRSPADADTPWEYFPIRDEKGEYRLEHVLVQDAMAWETQGAPTDRTQEHLGVGDEGVILLRKIVREQIEIVRKGGEPLGIVRDAGKNQLIEFDVINERVGLFGRQQKVA